MRKAVQAKFDQYEDLRQKLLSTGDAILEEENPRDPFWGIGKDKNGNKGQNQLGLMLMQIREDYKKQEKKETAKED